jgi:hypothetical protein
VVTGFAPVTPWPTVFGRIGKVARSRAKTPLRPSAPMFVARRPRVLFAHGGII